MESFEKERLIARISAGFLRFNFGGRPHMLFPPTREQRYIGEEIYNDVFEEVRFAGLLTSQEAVELRIKMGEWSKQEEERLLGLQKDIEQLKVGLVEHSLRSNEQKVIRLNIERAEKEVLALYHKKHLWDDSTIEGVCNLARFHFFLLAGLTDHNRVPCWHRDDFLDQPTSILEPAISIFSSSRLSERQFRELARTEPWHGRWSLIKSAEQMFKVAGVDLTEDQKALCLWSKMYDNIYDHSECPSDEIINDDYALDGWMIIQRRKRHADKDREEVEAKVGNNPKIANAGEIFVVADTEEDAKKINAVNPLPVKIMKQQRQRVLEQKGIVKETEMPDVEQKLRLAFNQMRKG